ELVADKYALRFHRSSPDRKHAVVVAEEREPGSAAGFVLRRAHGKLRNVWREALIEQAGGALSKREAVERVRAGTAPAGPVAAVDRSAPAPRSGRAAGVGAGQALTVCRKFCRIRCRYSSSVTAGADGQSWWACAPA